MGRFSSQDKTHDNSDFGLVNFLRHDLRYRRTFPIDPFFFVPANKKAIH